MTVSNFTQPAEYEALLADKTAAVNNYFEGLNLPQAALHRSPPEHYRMRAEFRLWHEADDCFYAMFAPEDRKTPIRVDRFPVASESINRLMPALIAELNRNVLLKKRCFQTEFLSTLSGEMLITLIYHRHLDEAWLEAANALATALGCEIIGRSRKQKLVVGDDFVTERLTINGREFSYLQHEGSFTQPNALVNQQMITWACQQVAERPDSLNKPDLLELYCGNGNFTLPLSQYFDKVLATEISKVSIRALQQNCQDNQIDNIAVARMSAEEVSEAIRGQRPFRRLSHVDLDSHQFGTVFVDPPRAGLDDFTRSMVADFDNILYISCNPITMARDLKQLVQTHSVQSFAFFDQFPYTDHMECGALLERRH